MEKAIFDNIIPVTGYLVLVCENEISRDKLWDLIASKDDNIKMKVLPKKRQSITIVGLRESYKNDEIINQLLSQNQFLKLFSNANEIK